MACPKINKTKLRYDLERDEGRVDEIYIDSLGHKTFGIGHLVLETDPEYNWPEGTEVDSDRVEECFDNDIAEAEMEKAQMKQQTDAQKNELEMQKAMMKVQMEQQHLELKAKEQQIDAARDLLKVETERAKLEADISAKEIELAIKMKEVDNKEEDNDMKTVLSAVDKMAKANNVT